MGCGQHMYEVNYNQEGIIMTYQECGFPAVDQELEFKPSGISTKRRRKVMPMVGLLASSVVLTPLFAVLAVLRVFTTAVTGVRAIVGLVKK